MTKYRYNIETHNLHFINVIKKSLNFDFEYEEESNNDGIYSFIFKSKENCEIFELKYNALLEILEHPETKISFYIVDELVEKYKSLYIEIEE